jgi:hypothetical protein
MPPKITNPTPKDLDDAIQATNQRLDELIQSNQQSMNAQLGQTHTKMDNQDQLMDSRFNTLTTMLHVKFASLTIPQPQTLPVTSALASASHISGLDTNFYVASPSIPVSLPANLLHTRSPQPTIIPPGYSPQQLGFSTGFNTQYTAAPNSPFQPRPYPYPTQPSP